MSTELQFIFYSHRTFYVLNEFRYVTHNKCKTIQADDFPSN